MRGPFTAHNTALAIVGLVSLIVLEESQKSKGNRGGPKHTRYS